MKVDDLLKIAVAKGASDLHLKAGSFPHVRVNGELVPLIDFKKLTKEDTLLMAFGIMNNRQKLYFKENSELDLAYGVKALGRFRVNVFQQRGTVSLVFRVIPANIKTFDELNLPEVLKKISLIPRGLILVTGTTGSGKSTSLATMIDYVNENETNHIVTIEDPIEFLHRDKKCIISQREVNVDTKSFADALRSSLRQDPDVILVGEMRDRETIETALLAAETGHVVFSTLHTLDATETINRIIAVFPPHHQNNIRIQLASLLRAVVSMRLLRRSDGKGRVPAIEVLVVTEFVRNCINDPTKTKFIKTAIASGTSQYGMQTFDQSIFGFYKRGFISYEDALGYASNPDEFKLRVQGIYSTADSAQEEMEKEMERMQNL
ncbi:MAG TPA: type IV pilus twitching motility protein PilT [Acidobacteriota bacterium]|nr:type IV pilus twitching motility protein PilT [Acidobacteriota bacterium]HQM63665.1 type IV pilus twitching motility protein PilT [Acidobacteriota bacterium]